ncbi:MAG: ABC transporter permease [Akkermansiaceae bacterium]
MKVYFLRRLLLVPLTVLGVTFLVFAITRVMPGSPLAKELQAAAAGTTDGGGGGGKGESGALTEEQIEEFEREYLYDKPIPLAYLTWLGAYPRERLHSEADFKPATQGAKVSEETIGTSIVKDPEKQILISLAGTGRPVVVQRKDGEIEWARFVEKGKPMADWLAISDEGWEVRYETAQSRFDAHLEREKGESNKTVDNYLPRAVIFKSRVSGLLQGDFGRSSVFGEPVLDLIISRMPVALYFGILTTIISYGICLPLGILKAIKHRTPIDNVSSILIFLGYAIPGFALGALALVYFGVVKPIFPMIGLTSENFDSMSNLEKIKDLAWHSVLPLVSYLVGAFAWMTMMMKNNLMDNLAADYVRTAVAKGVGFNRAVFNHAFRNSFIPIATSLGQLITLIVTGSLLIETVFDIQGFGLLQFRAITAPDQMLIMGTLTVASFLMVMGNILSDVIVACVDPRVKFH